MLEAMTYPSLKCVQKQELMYQSQIQNHICPLRHRSHSTLKSVLLSKIVFTHFTLLASPSPVPDRCVGNWISDSGLEGNTMGLRRGHLKLKELRIIICKIKEVYD